MNSMRWRGTALVTGASSGLGEEFARQMAQRGCDIIAAARRADRLQAVCERIQAETGRNAVWRVVDLATEEGVQTLLASLDRERIVPDYLVNNAGRGYYGAAVNASAPTNQQMLRLNVEALTTLSLEIGKRMVQRGQGAILNVASAIAYQPAPYFAVYAATKAFVLSFSEALAAELSGSGVRVCTICPGATDSEFSRVAGFRTAIPFATSARDCVRRSLNAFESGSLTYIDGPLNAAGVLFARFIPRAFVTRAIAIATQK
jgi:short-subunit dehydrogenase